MAKGPIRRAGSRRSFTAHVYYFEVHVPFPVLRLTWGRLTWIVSFWPWQDGELAWRWDRGHWPGNWHELKPVPLPIMSYRTFGPVHVRYLRDRPAA